MFTSLSRELKDIFNILIFSELDIVIECALNPPMIIAVVILSYVDYR